jgi:cathepsin X
MPSPRFVMFALLSTAGLAGIGGAAAGKCGRASVTTPAEERVLTPHPATYIDPGSLPANFDWRFYRNSTSSSPPSSLLETQNLCSRVLTQQVPHVCGSCWAEAATGALSDRYTIATSGALRVQLAPQVLLNFVEDLTGGSCMGGNDLDAYKFVSRFGITDDTCAPFLGMNYGCVVCVRLQQCERIARRRRCGDRSTASCTVCGCGRHGSTD